MWICTFLPYPPLRHKDKNPLNAKLLREGDMEALNGYWVALKNEETMLKHDNET